MARANAVLYTSESPRTDARTPGPPASTRRFQPFGYIALTSRMIFPFGMPLQLLRIKVNLAQIAGRIPLRLVVEMLRPDLPALATGSHCLRAHLRSEFHYGHETVS